MTEFENIENYDEYLDSVSGMMEEGFSSVDKFVDEIERKIKELKGFRIYLHQNGETEWAGAVSDYIIGMGSVVEELGRLRGCFYY